MSEPFYVSPSIHFEKVVFSDSLAILLQLIPLLAPVGLQWAMNSHIKSLINMSAVQDLTSKLNVLIPCMIKKLVCDVAAMSIDGQPPNLTCVITGLFIKISDVLNTEFVVNPTIFRYCNAVERSVRVPRFDPKVMLH